jgi:uncharacterized delta-60 repeat protein
MNSKCTLQTRRFLVSVLIAGLALSLAGLLVLFLVLSARADLTPGALDTGFDPGTGTSNTVQAVALQRDGKVLVGGYFTQVDGVARNNIARLNADGVLDTNFDPGTGANGLVYAVASQPDGKVLIGGVFTQVNGVERNSIARLNANGSLDTTFDPGTGANDQVWAVAIQSDGKVLIGGDFTQVNGVGRGRIARLNPDGSVDTSFDPGAGANWQVFAVALQLDGKVLIGGNFVLVNGASRPYVARLNADGSLDTNFDPGTVSYIVDVIGV